MIPRARWELRAVCSVLLAGVVSGGAAFAQVPAQSSSPSHTAAAPAAPSVDQILDKYAEATGGRAAWQKVTSRVSKGTIEVEGMNIAGAVEMREKVPNRVVVTVTISGAAFIQGFDGTVGWSSDPQNGVRELNGAELAETRRDADFHRLLDLRSLYAKVNVAGTEKIDEHDAYVVEATPSDGGDADKIYFDSQTGLALRSITQHHMPDGSVEPFQEDFEDYRAVDGVKMPFTIRQKTSEAVFTIRIDEVHQNVALDDAGFAKPTAQ